MYEGGGDTASPHPKYAIVGETKMNKKEKKLVYKLVLLAGALGSLWYTYSWRVSEGYFEASEAIFWNELASVFTFAVLTSLIFSELIKRGK